MDTQVDLSQDDDFTGPINLGNPRGFTNRELAEIVVAMTGSRSNLVEKPLPADDPMQRQPNIGLARDKLDWSPAVELKAGLAKTIVYFQELFSDYAPTKSDQDRT